MQLRGWGLSRAGRIVIILLVVQLLGLSPILAVAPSSVADPGTGGHPHGAGSSLAVLPTAVAMDPALMGAAPLEGDLDRAARPAAVLLPRRLPRAPPAA